MKKALLSFLQTTTARVIMILLFYVLFFSVFLLLMSFDLAVIAWIYGALFFYFGWKAVSSIQANWILVMSTNLWILYFVIKAILSLFAGIFVAPFFIANKIASYVSEVAGEQQI